MIMGTAARVGVSSPHAKPGVALSKSASLAVPPDYGARTVAARHAAARSRTVAALFGQRRTVRGHSGSHDEVPTPSAAAGEVDHAPPSWAIGPIVLSAALAVFPCPLRTTGACCIPSMERCTKRSLPGWSAASATRTPMRVTTCPSARPARPPPSDSAVPARQAGPTPRPSFRPRGLAPAPP